MIDLSSYIQAYCKARRETILDLESYKWAAFKHFKENYNKRFDTTEDWIAEIFAKADNLLASNRYYPLGVLKDFSCDKGGEPVKLQMLLRDLLQKDLLPTPKRVRSFIEGSKSIMQDMAANNYSNWNGRTNLNTYQDAHAISVYLSMFYPNDFYIYKYSIFREFSKIIEEPIVQTDAIDRLFEYQSLCDRVKSVLRKDSDLIYSYNKWLNQCNYEDDNLNLLTQDFIYAVVVYLNSDTYIKVKNNKSRIGKLVEITAQELSPTYTSASCSYKVVKDVDYNRISKQNESLGFAGELWVVNFEKERLRKLKIDHNKVRHASKLDGDGCWYDVLSVEDDGETLRYIEVKTTSKEESQPIFFSDNELKFSKMCKEHYYLYRVYNFKSADDTADLTIVKAGLDELNAVPIVYKAKISQQVG